jgi:hypothetical protein
VNFFIEPHKNLDKLEFMFISPVGEDGRAIHSFMRVDLPVTTTGVTALVKWINEQIKGKE